MKKLLTILVAVMTAWMGAKAQVAFDPQIDVNFSKIDTIQVPKSFVKTQVLFVGGTDEVTYLNSMGLPGGTNVSKPGNDFVGITQDGEDYWITVNHETSDPDPVLGGGGGMTTFKAVWSGDSLSVAETQLPDNRTGKFHNVDFVNSVGATINNCGGIISENGEIWTAEEYPGSYSPNSNYFEAVGDSLDVIIGSGSVKPFLVDNTLTQYNGQRIKAFQNNGWMVKIDPKTGKALQKQYNWGRMSFEAGAISADNKTVYLAEDGTPGLFTKFVAEVAGDFTQGDLYVYNQTATGPDGKWIKMNNDDLTEMIYLADSAYKRGATAFIRLEWITQVNGKIYIAETGLDLPSGLSNALQDGGNVAEHHFIRASAQGTVIESDTLSYHDYYGRILVYDPATDNLSVLLEGGPEHPNSVSDSTAAAGGSYPEIHLSNPDGLGKVSIGGSDYLVINEDLNGSSYNRLPFDHKGDNSCEMYLLDLSVSNPTLADLKRIAVGPKGAELTGGNGTPDGNIIFVDVQHPKSSVFPFTTGLGATISLTGFNSLADIDDAVIDVDWSKTAEFQGPAGGIKTQILFVGGSDSVSIVDGSGLPAGMAKSRAGNDFIGITADEADYWLAVNHETASPNQSLGGGGGMSAFKVSLSGDSLVVVETTLPDGRTGKYHSVDFVNTVGATINNCGGIISASGEIWTAEEYPGSYSPNSKYYNAVGDSMDVIIGEGQIKPFRAKNMIAQFEGQQIKAFQNNGWMVKIDPITGMATQKQYNWGRMSFEAGAISSDNTTVYLAEDGTPGMFTKFVSDEEGDFNSGSLYVFNQEATGEDGKWIKMNNDNLDEMINLADSAYKRGATAFIRLEWITQIGGKIYIAETGLDSPTGLSSAIAKGGNVAQHHLDRAAEQQTVITEESVTYKDFYGRILVYDPETDDLSVYLEGGPALATSLSDSTGAKGGNYPAKHLSNPDGLGKITVGEKDYLIICEDLNGFTYNRLPNDFKANNTCEMYLLDASLTNPTIDDLTRIMVGPKGAELTGGNGTPDGKVILVNIQHPKASVFPYTNGHGVTVALSGWDYVPNNEAEITSFVIASLDPEVEGEIVDTVITIEVPASANVTSLVPEIEFSVNASVVPASGVAQDFTNPVVYTVTAENGNTQQYSVSVSQLPTDVKDQIGIKSFDVFPNPAVEMLYLNGVYDVAIYNADGKLIKVRRNTNAVNISELAPGSYYIKNQNGDIKKLIIE